MRRRRGASRFFLLGLGWDDPALNYPAPSYASLLLGAGHGGRGLLSAGLSGKEATRGVAVFLLGLGWDDPALNYPAPSYASLLLGAGHGGRGLISAGLNIITSSFF